MASKFAIGAGGNWNDDTTWSTTSGGSNDTTKPTAADDVFLDAASGPVTLDVTPVCRSLDCNGYTNTLTHNTGVTLTIGDGTAGAGNRALRLVSGMTYTLGNQTSSAIAFVSTSTTQQTVTWGGKTCGNITHTGIGGSWTPTDAVICGGQFGFNNGVYDNSVNNVTHTVSTFSIGGSALRNMNMGTATWNIISTAATPVFAISFGSNLTFNGANATIVIFTQSTSVRTFAGQGQTYGTLTYTVAGSTGGLDITGSNTFTNFNFSDSSNARTLRFTAGTTTTVTNFNVNGTAGKIMTIGSITAASHTLSKSSGSVLIDYVSISRSTAQGGATWTADINSINGGNNSGWIFAAEQLTGVTGYINQGRLEKLMAKAGSSPGLRRFSDLRRVVYGDRGGAYNELQYLRNRNSDASGVNEKESDAWTKFGPANGAPGTRADEIQHNFTKSGTYP